MDAKAKNNDKPKAKKDGTAPVQKNSPKGETKINRLKALSRSLVNINVDSAARDKKKYDVSPASSASTPNDPNAIESDPEDAFPQAAGILAGERGGRPPGRFPPMDRKSTIPQGRHRR